MILVAQQGSTFRKNCELFIIDVDIMFNVFKNNFERNDSHHSFINLFFTVSVF